MKVTKIFGCVLGLHLCIIAVLLVQPGCQTGQPPTQTHTQNRAIKSSVQGASRTSGDLIPADRVGGLDSAFNAGVEGDTGFEPMDDFPALEPLPGGQTVDIAGPGFQTYTVKKGDSLWKISKNYGVTLNELYSANGLNKNSILSVGQQIQIPGEGSTATVNTVTPEVYQPSGYNQATTSYTVQGGDTLSRIANKFDTTVGAIKAANGKSTDMIRVGEVLSVPVGANANTSSSATTTSIPASPTTSASFAPSGGATQTHTVKAGEYPAKIAKQYGMTTSELLAVNGITDPRKLRVGQQLTVSGTGSASNVDSRVETVVSPTVPSITPIAPAQPVRITEPTNIRVIEADPIVEGELPEPETDDDVFGGAVEIPVIRLAD